MDVQTSCPVTDAESFVKPFKIICIGNLPSEAGRKDLLQVLLTMIDPTTGPLITHHKAVLSFMSQQLQRLKKERDGERGGKERYHNKVNKLASVFKAAGSGRLVLPLIIFLGFKCTRSLVSPCCSFLLHPSPDLPETDVSICVVVSMLPLTKQFSHFQKRLCACFCVYRVGDRNIVL